MATLLVLGSLGLGGCGNFYTVYGRVRSCADHSPVSNASVHLTQRDDHNVTATDVDGAYRVAIAEAPNDATAQLRVQKDGYQTLDKPVHHNLELAQDVCIEPIGKR